MIPGQLPHVDDTSLNRVQQSLEILFLFLVWILPLEQQLRNLEQDIGLEFFHVGFDRLDT